MLTLAREMTTEANANAAQPAIVNKLPVSEAEKLAGFKVIQPAWLPEGYHLDFAKYFPEYKTVCLEYRHPGDGDDKSSSLTIAESSTASLPALTDLFPSDPTYGRFMETENRTVGGAKSSEGVYAYGDMDTTKVCGERSYQDQVLQMQAENIQVMIFTRRSSSTGQRNFLTRQQMVRLAESMTGVHTISDDQLDPDLITSVTDAERLIGFHLKLPTKLPEGVSFDHIRYSKDGQVIQIVVIYTGGVGPEIDITFTIGSTETLEKLYNELPETWEKVKVNGMDGILSQGFYNSGKWMKLENGGDGAVQLIWFEDGIKHSITGFNAYSRQVWLEIAESSK